MTNYDEWIKALHGPYTHPTKESKASTKQVTQKEIDNFQITKPKFAFTEFVLTSQEPTEILRNEELFGKVGILSYASYTDPGCNWRMGGRDQEALLCSCSTLYPCLAQYEEFYAKHREDINDGLFSSDCLFIDKCFFTEGEDFKLITREASVLSMAAPVQMPINDDRFELILLSRIRDIVRVFNMFQCDTLIVGDYHMKHSNIMEHWGTVLRAHDGLFKTVYIVQN